MYARQRMDLYDTVRVHGPDRCHAVRVVGSRVVREAAGALPEVVAEVESWSLVGGAGEEAGS